MASFSGIKNTLLAEQSDEEAAPAHDPNLKSSKAPERYAPGPCCHFLWKKIMLSGALRRLAIVLLSLSGNHDDTHCYRFAFIDHLAKCRAHKPGVCRLLVPQACTVACIICFKYLILKIKSLSADSELINRNRSSPDKVLFIWAALIDSKDPIQFFFGRVV